MRGGRRVAAGWVLGMLVACGAWAGWGGGGAVAGETVVVGTNAEFPPFEFRDKDNEIIGFDVDLVKAIAREAGFEVRFVNHAFDTLITSLAGGRIQLIAAGLTITDERKELIDFSAPYYSSALVMVVREGTEGIERIGDIVDRRVAVQLGTTGAAKVEEVMTSPKRQLRQFRLYREAFAELTRGNADVVVVDLPVALNYMRHVPGLTIAGEPMDEDLFGLGVAKDNPALRDKVNRGLARIRESGEYDRLVEKWFGEESAANGSVAPEKTGTETAE